MDTELRPVELRELWSRVADDDRVARDRLVLAYSPLVKYVAGKVASGLPPHVDQADLVSYGLVGLTTAVDRFDTGRQIKFETFALQRIRGAILDELRSQDWVPRSVRARARQIEKATGKLEGKLQRAPTEEEVAAALETTVEAFREDLSKIASSSVIALDEPWMLHDSSGDQVSLLDTIEDPEAVDPADALEAVDMRRQMAESIATLPERERLVIALYYYENLTLREIGEVLGVTESRVSQLHTKATLSLRGAIATAA